MTAGPPGSPVSRRRAEVAVTAGVLHTAQSVTAVSLQTETCPAWLGGQAGGRRDTHTHLHEHADVSNGASRSVSADGI